MRADYGLDAPGVVRNLFIAAIAGLLVWLFLPAITIGHVRLLLGSAGLWIAIGCGFTGIWMVYASKIGKVRERETLLDRVAWRGDEQVLDVGCGRGLLLVGAAKRLTSGKATGIDIWQAEDLSGNRAEATIENARREGVADRVKIETADMRKMPFPDATFDVIVSRAVIHNLYNADDRAKAVAEIARVLKPGGRALIDDIRHGREYRKTFEANGCKVTEVGSLAVSLFWMLLTFGSLRPTMLVVNR
jgi:arsenite methyltransferase